MSENKLIIIIMIIDMESMQTSHSSTDSEIEHLKKLLSEEKLKKIQVNIVHLAAALERSSSCCGGLLIVTFIDGGDN